MFISVVCVNTHICKTNPRNDKEEKLDLCSFEITNHISDGDFQVPWAEKPMPHAKDHIDLQLK